MDVAGLAGRVISMKIKLGRVAQLLIVAALIGGHSSSTASAQIRQMYVFGDSYSDSGRGFADNDGPTAVVYLAHRLGFQLVPSTKRTYRTESLNFAVAGASTGSNPGVLSPIGKLYSIGMKNQVGEFLEMKRSNEIAFVPGETLFFLAGGLNDRNRSTAEVAANLASEVRDLYNAGGRRFRIAVLPESIPAYHDVAVRLNSAIGELPGALSEQLKGIDCQTSEWGVYIDQVMQNAARFGFTDTTDACTGRTMFQEDSTPCAVPRTHFYYHKSHPSTAVHAIVGARLYSELNKSMLNPSDARRKP
jgi:phospholipase/lecithinase/hemolysin